MSPARRHKYNVSHPSERTVDGILFASKKEARRYGELKLLQRAGKVRGLECQPEYEIRIGKHKICSYRADFQYYVGNKLVIEDVKGVKTPVYRIKKKLVEAIYGVKIQET